MVVCLTEVPHVGAFFMGKVVVIPWIFFDTPKPAKDASMEATMMW